jgi:hypothetical protein
LVLGGQARYLDTDDRARDGRWGLLDRIGAGEVRERPTSLDRTFLDGEKAKLRAFLADQRDQLA